MLLMLMMMISKSRKQYVTDRILRTIFYKILLYAAVVEILH